jgi:hypothetical protein
MPPASNRHGQYGRRSRPPVNTIGPSNRAAQQLRTRPVCRLHDWGLLPFAASNTTHDDRGRATRRDRNPPPCNKFGCQSNSLRVAEESSSPRRLLCIEQTTPESSDTSGRGGMMSRAFLRRRFDPHGPLLPYGRLPQSFRRREDLLGPTTTATCPADRKTFSSSAEIWLSSDYAATT